MKWYSPTVGKTVIQRFAKPFMLPSTQTLLVPEGRFSWRWDWIKERVSENDIAFYFCPPTG